MNNLLKEILFSSILLLLSCTILVAQTRQSTIQEIRSEYYSIRDSLHTFDTTMIMIWDESTEGGHAIGFYDDQKLKHIEVAWAGETGQRFMGYYFHDEKLIFAFHQDLIFNRPFYWTAEVAKENGDSETHDPDKTIILENRYYFRNESLFLWLDDVGEEVDLRTNTPTVVSLELLTHARKIKALLAKKSHLNSGTE